MKCLQKLAKIKDDKNFFVVMVSTFLFGLIAHGYCYFNLFYSFDALVSISQYSNIVWQISLGRFLQAIYLQIRGGFYVPSLVGFLSLLFIGLSAYFVLRLLDIKNRFLVCLICGILTINITVILLNATFLPWLDIDMFSLLSAVVGVCCIRKFRKGGVIAAPLFFFVSLGLYQSFFQVAVVLLMILSIKDILDRKQTKEVLQSGIKAVISLLAGLVLYYLVLQAVLYATGVKLSTGYNGINRVGQYGGITSILWCIYETYHRVLSYFLHPIVFHREFMALADFIIIGLAAVFLIGIVIKKKIRGWDLFLLAGLILFMPFGINVICFISQGMEHELMIYSFFFVYIFALYLGDVFIREEGIDKIKIEKIGKIQILQKYSIPVLVVVLLFNNIIFANQTYLYKNFVYQNTLLVMERVIDRIEQVDGYVVGETPVAIVGSLEKSKLANPYDDFEKLGFGLGNAFSVDYYETYVGFFRDLLRYPINLLSFEEFLQWEGTEAVQEMPVFPEKGSCKMIDGTMVIKFS